MPHATIHLLSQSTPPEDGSNLGAFLLALGIVILTVTLLFRLRRRLRSGRPLRTQSGNHAPQTNLSLQRQTLEALMVEVQELTRLCAAQMENRATRLEKLIREADDRLAKLEQHTGVRDHSVRIPERPGAPSAFLRHHADPITDRIYQLADKGVPSVEIARELDEHTGKVDLILALRDR